MKFLFYMIFTIWLLSLAVHSFGYSFIPAQFLAAFSDFDFYSDVKLLAEDKEEPQMARAFGGHMVLAVAYMVITATTFALIILREIARRTRAVPRSDIIPGSFLASCLLLVLIGAYFLLWPGFSAFENGDRHFHNMPLWWVLALSTGVWPFALLMATSGLLFPEHVRQNWKLKP